MKKNFVLLSGLFLFLTACSNDDNNNTPPVAATPSYMLDNHSYSLLALQGISEIKMENVLEANGTNYDRSTISLVGLNGFTETGTLNFDLYYKHGMSVAGTYTIYDAEDDEPGFDDFVGPLDRACLGWTSLGVIFNSANSSQVDANNPTGTVKIVVNSATNYTIQYTGNFRIYDDNFEVVRNVPASVNVSGDIVVN